MSTVTFNGVRLNSADSNNGWSNFNASGPSPAAEAQLKYQGTSAVNKKVTSTTSRSGVCYLHGASIDMDTGVIWASFTGERQIGADWYAFGAVINGNNASAEEIYEFVQWSLRQTGDIDAGAGTQIGLLAEDLMVFVGDTLRTLRQSDGDGVFIDNFNSNDTNRLEFQDDNYAGTARTFPFKAAGTITFNTNIVNDTDAQFWMFFKDAGGNQIDTANAIMVHNDAGADITGLVSGQASVSFDFDYDGNVQGGRTLATNATVVIRVMGLNTTQYVEAEFTISRATGLNFPMTGVLERNYLNAA